MKVRTITGNMKPLQRRLQKWLTANLLKCASSCCLLLNSQIKSFIQVYFETDLAKLYCMPYFWFKDILSNLNYSTFLSIIFGNFQLMPLHYRFYHACALHSIRHIEIVQTNTSLQSIQKRYILRVLYISYIYIFITPHSYYILFR